MGGVGESDEREGEELIRRRLACALRGLRNGLLIIKVLGEEQGGPRAFFHGTLDGFLVTAQGFATDGVAQVAGFNIQENLYLPWLECVTVHRPT